MLKVEPGQVYHDAFGGRMDTCVLVTRRKSADSWMVLMLLDEDHGEEGRELEVLESSLLRRMVRMP